MYSGVRQELEANISPVDLFHVSFKENIESFPLLKEVQMWEFFLEAGDCVFIPAWWWVQS